MTRTLIRAAVALLAAGAAVAQPTLDSLWPADDGTRWEYTFHVFDHDGDIDFTSPAFLQLSGTAMTPGGEAQVLLEGHDEVPESRDAAPRGLSSLLARAGRAAAPRGRNCAKLSRSCPRGRRTGGPTCCTVATS